jgi:hypothetical protein
VVGQPKRCDTKCRGKHHENGGFSSWLQKEFMVLGGAGGMIYRELDSASSNQDAEDLFHMVEYNGKVPLVIKEGGMAVGDGISDIMSDRT